MLKVDGLNQYYGGSHILRNVGFEAKQGEVTVVLGRNGVGKTTLLKSLMGVVPVKTGSMVLAGTDITHATPYDRVRLGMGYVPQGREIFGRLTVEDNLKMGLAVKPGGTPLPAQLFELFPMLQAVPAPARRRPVGRPAAAVGHRPGAGCGPAPADPGRAHRRHPAQHHQGHRPRHPPPGRRRPERPAHGRRSWWSSTTTLPPNWPTSTW
jgi:ABC-type glutathione transport system ATPase component